jgi:hypothetical protein
MLNFFYESTSLSLKLIKYNFKNQKIQDAMLIHYKNINCKKNIIHVTTILGRFWRGIGVLSLDKKIQIKEKTPETEKP